MQNDFNVKLRSLRKSRKKTQEDISKMLNITRSCYGEYERGKIKPPMDKLKFLANYFNVTTDYLIGTNEEEIKIVENIDVSKIINEMIGKLKDNDENLTFDGETLDDETKRLLISSLKNSIETSRMIRRLKNESERERVNKEV